MFYYGEAPHGKKLHMGNFRLDENFVQAFCGCEMADWDSGERPPNSRVGEYCKNCFRTYAWHIMTVEVQEMANLTQAIEDLIETPFTSVEAMKQQLTALLDGLRQSNEQAFTPQEPVQKEGEGGATSANRPLELKVVT